MPWCTPRHLSPPRAQQAPEEAGGARGACAQGLAVAVAHPLGPGATAHRGVCIGVGPAIAPLCGPRSRHGWSDQRRARATLVSRQERRLVCGPCRPPDAGDQHALRSGPSPHRAETVRDARVPSSSREPTGVAHGARTPGQSGALSPSSPACRSVGGGSGRRARTHTRLDAQSAHPHLGRFSMSS
jgi:hypothetical protein